MATRFAECLAPIPPKKLCVSLHLLSYHLINTFGIGITNKFSLSKSTDCSFWSAEVPEVADTLSTDRWLTDRTNGIIQIHMLFIYGGNRFTLYIVGCVRSTHSDFTYWTSLVAGLTYCWRQLSNKGILIVVMAAL